MLVKSTTVECIITCVHMLFDLFHSRNYTDPDKKKWPPKNCGRYIRISKYPLEVYIFKNYFPQLQRIFAPKEKYVNEAIKR